MLILNLPLQDFQGFTFVLVRVGAILFSLPFLEARNTPMMIKAGLAMAVSVMLLPQLSLPEVTLMDQPVALAIGLLGEAAIGLIIGLTVQLLFAGIQLAGQIAGFQMGFAIANVVDPSSSLQIPILSQFLNLFALMIFFTINAHFYFIKALVESFDLIPPMGVGFSGELFEVVLRMAGNMFIIAVKVSAPIMVALLLTQVALGLTARTVPQMQIFIVAMPLQIIMGLFFMGLSLPFLMPFFDSAFKDLARTIIGMMRLFHG